MASNDQYRARFSLVREVRNRFLDLKFSGAPSAASGIVTISGSGTLTTIVTVNGTAVSTAWAVSNAATATAVAAALNANTTVNKLITATANGVNVLLTANLSGAKGAAITVVVSGTAASTYNFATQGTLVGGTGGGLPMTSQSVVTLTSASGVVGVTINGETVTVTASGGDGPTAVLLQAAIAADAVASRFVTASIGSTSLTNATVILVPTAAFIGTDVTIVPAGTGTGVTVDNPVLGTSSSGLIRYPESRGIANVYQLNAGYYMLSLEDTFKELLVMDHELQVTAASAPTASKVFVLSDSTSAVSAGYLLLSGMTTNDTFSLSNKTFTCVASGASTKWTIVASGSVNLEKGDSVVVAGINCPFTPGATDTLTATAIAASINANASAVASATSSVGTVTITLVDPNVNISVDTGTGPVTGITIPAPTFNVGTTPRDSETAVNIAAQINRFLGAKGFTATAVAITPLANHGGAVIITSTAKNAGFSTTSVRAAAFPSTGALQNGGAVFFVTANNADTLPLDNVSPVIIKAQLVLQNEGNQNG